MTAIIKVNHHGRLVEIEVESEAAWNSLNPRAQEEHVIMAADGVDAPIAKARMTFASELLKFATTAKVSPARAVNEFVSTELGAQLYLTTHSSSEVTKSRRVDAHKRAETLKDQLDTAAADYARQQQAFGKQLDYEQALAAVKETTKGAELSEQLDDAYAASLPAAYAQKSAHHIALEKEYMAAEDEFLKQHPKREFLMTPVGKRLREALNDEHECSIIEQQVGPTAGLEARKLAAKARRPPEVDATKAKTKGAALELETLAKAHAFDKGCSLVEAYGDLVETPAGLALYQRAEKEKLTRSTS